MKHEITVHVWAIRDAVGEEHLAITDSVSDTIIIEATDHDGKQAWFESDACYLETWADEYGFDYRHFQRTIEFQDLFGGAS